MSCGGRWLVKTMRRLRRCEPVRDRCDAPRVAHAARQRVALDIQCRHATDRSTLPERPTLIVSRCPTVAERRVPAGTLPRDVVRSIGERLLQAAIAVAGRRRGAGPHDAAARRAGRFRVLTEKDPQALDVLRHSGGAHPGDGGAPPAPRREDRLRPRDRGRLLLRLRGRRSRSRPTTSRRSRRRCARSRRRSCRSCARR